MTKEQDRNDRILWLYLSGVPVPKIAQELKMSPKTVASRLRDELK